jgi:hypothetical protein
MTWVRARGVANNTATKLLAYDSFLQTEGNLAGKTLPLGGTWAGAGDAEPDFKVIAAEDLAQRTTKADETLYLGRYAIAGSEEPTTSKASVTTYASKAWFGERELWLRGVFLRYTNTENWLMAAITNSSFFNGAIKVMVLKRVAGTVTKLGEAAAGGESMQTTKTTVALSASAEGIWQAWTYPASLTTQPQPLLEGQDSVLATGGTLAKGKGGFYDAAWKELGPAAVTVSYDDFNLLAGEPAGVVLYSGKSAEWRSDAFLRADSTGTYYGEPSNRGGRFYLQPGGEAGLKNRIVVALRRNDIVTEADDHVEDKHTIEIKATPRYLTPR